MNQEQKVIRVKVGVLELAKQPGNVSATCRVMGYSRDSASRCGPLTAPRTGEEAMDRMTFYHNPR